MSQQPTRFRLEVYDGGRLVSSRIVVTATPQSMGLLPLERLAELKALPAQAPDLAQRRARIMAYTYRMVREGTP